MQLYRMHHSGKNLEIPQCIFYGVGVRLLVVGQWPACLEHLPFQHNFPHDNFGRPKNMALVGLGSCSATLSCHFFFLLASSPSFLNITRFRGEAVRLSSSHMEKIKISSVSSLAAW